MDDPREHRLFERSLRMVIWGDKREEVYHMLSVNGVTGAEADAVYAAARREVTAAVRDAGRQKVKRGLMFLGGCALAFSVCWFGLGFIPVVLLYAVCAMVGVGLWNCIDGLTSMLRASKKEGPLE